MAKLTFADLNSFINLCVWDLHDYETIFYNQLIASVEQEQNLNITRKKLTCLIDRCDNLKEQQNNVDMILDYVTSRVNQLECLVTAFEKRHDKDMKLDTCDCQRKEMYEKSEKIAIGLHNWQEFISIFEQQPQNDQNEPIQILFRVIANCYELLDKLHVHSLKLNNAVSVSEQMIKQLFQVCRCNQ